MTHRNALILVGTRAYYFTTDIGAVVAEYGRHITIELPEGDRSA